MRLVAAGLSFRTAPIAVRERAALGDLGSRQLLRYLVGHSGLSGALAISTCNRTELYVSCPPDGPVEEVVPRLTRYLDPSGRGEVADGIVTWHDDDAVAHLFRVAAGLESMVIGEHQVLGQVRAAHRLAQEAGTLDAHLDIVARRAISAGKRVRHETALGRERGGLSQAAVDLAAQRCGDLRGRRVLLIGAGKVSAVAARSLRDHGAALTVVSRGKSAVHLAAEVGGSPAVLDDLLDLIAGSDIVISSTTSEQPVITAQDVTIAQHRRDGAPLLLIDLAVPRDIDAGAAQLPGVELVDVDAIGRSIRGTAVDAVAAEAIVASELQRALALIAERHSSAPAIRELLAHAEAMRLREVERALARMPQADEVMREQVDRMTRSLVAKLLHAPLRHLREVGDDPAAVLRVRDTFDLEFETADPGESSPR